MKVARPKYPKLAVCLALTLQQFSQADDTDKIPEGELFEIFNHVLSCQPYRIVGTLHPDSQTKAGVIIDDDGKEIDKVEAGDSFIA